MIDPAKKAAAGKPFAPSASAYNAVIDAANEFNLGKTRNPSGEAGESEVNPAVTVVVKNTTAGNLAPHSILTIADGLGSFPSKLLESMRRPTVEGATPAADTDIFCVLTDGIKAGKCGRGVVQGIATCTVNITDVDHNFAVPTAGQTGYLTSSETGTAYILAKEDTGTGPTSAMVLLGVGAAGGGGSSGVWLRVTSETATSSTYPAVLLTNNGDGTRSDGTVVRFKIISGAGDSVVDEGIYWATKNGTVTISDTTYDVYDGVGNDSETIKDCVDSVPGSRVWKVYHPFNIGSFTPD